MGGKSVPVRFPDPPPPPPEPTDPLRVPGDRWVVCDWPEHASHDWRWRLLTVGDQGQVRNVPAGVLPPAGYEIRVDNRRKGWDVTGAYWRRDGSVVEFDVWNLHFFGRLWAGKLY